MPEASASDFDIVIVGAGIAGLALAAALADAKLAICVLEAGAARGAPANPGAGPGDFDARVSALTPRSLDFLERLGAWALIDARRHCRYRHMTVWDAEGTGRIEFDAAEVVASHLGSIVENREIVAALSACATRRPTVQVRYGRRLASLVREAAHSALTLDNGERLRCRLLVAADGARSATRARLGLRTREWDYGQRAIVTTAEFENGHQATAWQRFLPTGPLALLPLPSARDRLCSIVWSIDEDRAEALLALDDEAFAKALGVASEHVLGRVLGCAERCALPLRQRHAPDYVVPGAALLGDAAHSIHPLAGQGINLGLADVDVLAEEVLRALERGLSPGRLEVLRRYQRRRKTDNLVMMAAMEGFKRLFEQDALPLRWLRNTGMRLLASVPPVKRRIVREAMGVT